MKISAVRVTPIAIKDPALLNAPGVHEPFGLRSVIEVVGANGMVGLGETYGDATVLDLLTRVKDSLVGLSAFDLLAELHQAFLNCRIRTRNDVTQMQKFRPDWSTVKPRF